MERKIKMRNTRKIYGLLLLIFALGLATAATTPVVAQKEVPTYTYELRSDAKFKDGTTLTAHDVKWTFDRVASLALDPSFLLADHIYATEVVDDTHVKFILSDDYGFFEPLLGGSIASVLKKDSVSANEAVDGIDGAIAWGAGAYRMTSEVRDVETVLERNPDYWGTPAKNAKVSISYYASNAILAAALEAGDIDLAFRDIDPDKMLDLLANEADDIEATMPPGGVTRYFVFPDQTVHTRMTTGIRQAISYAVDRDAIIAGVFSGVGVSHYTMVPPGWIGHLPTFPHRDLAKAKALLTAEGYSNANKFELELWYSPTHYGTTEASVAQVIKAALEETGMISVNLEFTEWADYKVKMNNKEMEAFLLGWYPDYIDTDNYLYPFYHSSGGGWGPFPNPPNIALEALLDDAKTSSDPAVRKAIYEQAQKIIADDARIVPLWYGIQFAAWKNYVSGVVLGPDLNIRYENIQKGPTTDGELRVGTTDKIITLDHADAYDYWSWSLIRHAMSTLVQYKEGSSTELEYLLATGPPTIAREVIGVETVITTMPVTTIVTTVVPEFGSCFLIVGGSLVLSVVLRASRRKRN